MPNKTIVAMLCVTILVACALFLGINGAALAAGVAVIAGLGGYVTGKTTKK